MGSEVKRILTYGGVNVPYTVSWTAEEPLFLARCPEANALALCQAERPGEGKPQFGKPHANRQRRAIARMLCDLCGQPLKTRTKVSLSHARPVPHGAEGWAILQVEPLLHRECAAICLEQCPSLKRDVREGRLMVRQVTRHRVQFAIMSAEYCAEVTGERRKAAGHAKVELLQWIERDAEWLTRGNGAAP